MEIPQRTWERYVYLKDCVHGNCFQPQRELTNEEYNEARDIEDTFGVYEMEERYEESVSRWEREH